MDYGYAECEHVSQWDKDAKFALNVNDKDPYDDYVFPG